jgi:hypothetical protein
MKKSNRKAGNVFIDGKRLRDFDVLNRFLNLDDRKISSLEGCPREINGYLTCDQNFITSLEGCPQKINGFLSCAFNKLTSLKGFPSEVNSTAWLNNNRIESFEGISPDSLKTLYCFDNNFTNLHDIHRHLHYCEFLNLCGNPIKSHVLGLLKIDGLETVKIDPEPVEMIINKYIPLGDIFACQEELIEFGFEAYAQL